ncbi:DNA topoisomerase III [Pseudomonas syringae pv. actinidiae ICMP 18804]|uniref:DNA topoisomerase III n=1 Tax=Pseudomonas syringae pv. actinidiae ICMP 18807 TaxID=1194404 RepID=S6TW59_PSESF|nr:DNA topoisomerase III [Pseudomonas syringae pv. actinidiae ICMP 18804]EPN30245.1 DNA topoisomerase III [Pseudomonas syringae pv. actinidiae ICMP 18807]OOK95345.1 hypothetical protein B0B36_18475 [Pseudomonas syringae pv. actinidifoliorum]
MCSRHLWNRTLAENPPPGGLRRSPEKLELGHIFNSACAIESDRQAEKAVQFKVVKQLLKEATGLFIATDADREGELIARQLIEYFG